MYCTTDFKKDMHGGFDQQINIVVFSLFQNNDSSQHYSCIQQKQIKGWTSDLGFDLQIVD
jgi:hypothetical protein